MVSPMRLGKHLAHAGVASRRASEKLVQDGRVSVNDIIVTDPARDVTEADDILLDGQSLAGGPGFSGGDFPSERVVYALNKPAGVVSTAKDTHRRPTVVSLVPEGGRRLYPVGRLDVDTTGLILLTDDGDLAHRLTHPSFEVPKTYRARVDGGRVSEAALRRLREGVDLEDGRTAPASVRQVAPSELELTIHEGRKRQVRRMCEVVGHPVIRLSRIAFGPLRLENLAIGAHRQLSQAEIVRLRKAIAASTPGAGLS
jgi:23S rRNA pseudouridine2605 synthase